MKKLAFILIIILILSGCHPNHEKSKVTLSAASSLMNSLIEIKNQFNEKHPSIEIIFNFNGSGSLRRQIEQGAPVDLFFIASHSDYDKLNSEGFIEEAIPILKNRLVLVQNENYSFENIEQLFASNITIAIATPEAVPVGTYAKQSLLTLNMWEILQSENRIMYTKNASHIKQLLKEGSVGAGIIYESDLLQSDEIRLVEKIDSSFHEPIQYYLTKINNDELNEARDLFYQYVLKETSLDIFEVDGFLINDEFRKLVNR